MFTFKILIAFNEQIDSMKADLTKQLPHIKSSHRVEALARGLGFKTYAALRAVDLFHDGPILADVSWTAFSSYLKEKGFEVTAKPLYLAIGRACIRLALGMPDYQSLAQQIYAENSKRDQGGILSDSSVEEFLRAYSLVSKIPHTRGVTKKRNAYNLKHLAEKTILTYPDGEESPPDYVATGSLVLAALSAGFWFKPLSGDLYGLHFNMLQSAIDYLECEIKPNGQLMRERKSMPGLNRFGGVNGRKCYEFTFDKFEMGDMERDFGMEFRCLGYNNGVYFYYSHTRKSIVALSASAHTPKYLGILGPLDAWKASSIWFNDSASKRIPIRTVDALMQMSSKRGLFVPEDHILGLGNWKSAS